MTERDWADLTARRRRTLWTRHDLECIATQHAMIQNRTTGDMLGRVMTEFHGLDAESARVVIEAGALALFGVRLDEIGGRSKLTKPQAFALGWLERGTANLLLTTARPVRLPCVFDCHLIAARRFLVAAEREGFDLRIVVGP